jgi:hypothetical protein
MALKIPVTLLTFCYEHWKLEIIRRRFLLKLSSQELKLNNVPVYMENNMNNLQNFWRILSSSIMQ